MIKKCLRLMTLVLGLAITNTVTAVPVAVLTISPYPAFVGQTVSFDGSTSYDTEVAGLITLWEWDINNDGVFDASTTMIGIATYAFSMIGDFPVTLRVTNGAGVFDDTVGIARIVEAPQRMPEPSTLALLGLVLAGLATVRRRKQ